MKIALYTLAILFSVYALLILPNPVHVVHILLFIGGSSFFIKQLYNELTAKQKS